MDSPRLMSHYLVVRAGSRNEVEPGLSGFAHFFEHMMFRGTERVPPEAYNRVLKSLGADSNAFTSDDWTCYHVTAASSALERIMDLESDRFQNLSYGLEAFQKEAGAVLGEYNKSSSMPLVTLFEKLRDLAYTRHTYKHTTMGFLRDIQDMPNQYEYSREFFRRWYRPDNAALVVAGDVDPDRVFELARRFYGSWEAGAARVTPPAEPAQTGERTAHVPWKAASLPYLVVGVHVSAFDPDSVEGRALEVLAQAAFSETSPLFRDLVLDRRWAESVVGFVPARRAPSLFCVMARVKEPSRLAHVREALFGTFERLAREPLPPERIRAVQENLRYRFLRSLDTPDAVAVTLGEALQLTGETSCVDRSFHALERVRAGDIQDSARRFFAPENRTVVTLGREAEAGP